MLLALVGLGSDAVMGTRVVKGDYLPGDSKQVELRERTASGTSRLQLDDEAAARPHVSAGFGCKLASENLTEYIDYQWDALNSIHYHDAIAWVANGSTIRAHPESPACDFPSGIHFTRLVARARKSGVKIWLSTGNSGFGSFGPASSDEIIRFLSDETVRWRAIHSSLDAVKAGGLDGLSVDIEGDWRFNHSVRALHSAFLRDLATAGQRRSIPIRYPVFWDVYKDAAVDLSVVTEVTEATVLMTYDYHWGGDGRAGPNAPLVGCGINCSGEQGGANVERTISSAHNLSQGSTSRGGGSPNFLLGIAWYGLEYPTESLSIYGKTNYSLGPKRNYQVGGEGPKLCGSECRARKYGKLWDASTQTPWYRFQDIATGMFQQGYYDDSRSVALKYALAVGTNRSVSGLFIWPLNGNSLSTASWAWETLVNAVGLKTDPS